MTTNKTMGRGPQDKPEAGLSQQDLQAAQYAHTLAHLLYGQLAATYPWIQPYAYTPGMPMTAPLAAPPMTMAPGMGMYGPMMGPQPTTPWMQNWAGSAYAPTGGQDPASYWPGPGCCFGPELVPR
jgi:hypothetical protein